MKKKLISLLGLVAMFTLSGCGDKPGTETPDTEKPAPDTANKETVTVTKVEITTSAGVALTEEDLTVLDGTNFTLKAAVTGNKTGLKVDWTTSNAEVAKVTNGVVRFLSVTADTDVTITATSKDDKSKSDSVTFHVKHSRIDFASSRATNLDQSLFMSEGKLITDVGDTALVFSDVYDTKWYVQADIYYTVFSDTDKYPKFGIMTGNKPGVWNATSENDICYNNFFYLDTVTPKSTKSWNVFNHVTTDSTYATWDWGKQLGGFNYGVSLGETYTLGLLRDGQDYYQFITKPGEDGTPGEILCMNHVTDTLIPADVKTYAWVGGWGCAAEVSNFVSYAGDAADAMYKQLTTLDVNGDNAMVFLNETYQLNVKADVVNFDMHKITFTSSDETVATVSSTGLITAKDKPGTTKITVSYDGTINKEITFHVTDDTKFRVELDGKMEDPIWTEKVKKNFYRLNLNGKGEYIDFYSAMNVRGIYLYAEAHVNSMKSGEASGNWWENDNFEGRFVDTAKGTVISGVNPTGDKNDGQFWISANKTSNLDDFYVSDTTLNEATGKYDIVYETFTSFDTLNEGVEANTYNSNTPIAIYLGSNPASNWKAADFFNKPNEALRVTKDGFMHPDGNYCSEEQHAYGDWVVTKPNTCGEDGERTRTCKFCGHFETEVIAKDENAHVYDTEHATVKTPSTCATHGVGEASCAKCGKKQEVELPLDPTNHAGEFKDGQYTCCHMHVEAGKTAELDNFNNAGWKVSEHQLVIASELTGENWQVTYEYHNESNMTPGIANSDNVWKHGLNFVRDAVTNDIVVERMDWWGWADDGNGDGVHSLTGVPCNVSNANGALTRTEGWCNFDNEIIPVLTNMDVKATITKTGKKISCDYVITSPNVADKVFNYNFTINGVSETANITLGLAPEFAKISVKSAARIY